MIIRTTVATTLALLVLFVPAASGETSPELSLLAGTVQDADTGGSFHAWQLEFRNWMTERYAFSLSYLNEGHVPQHHRDGGALQAWAQTDLFGSGLFLAAGIGPYYFFDTIEQVSGTVYTNEHGWGAIGSLALTWQAGSRLNYQVRANVVETGTLNTRTLLFGAGYLWGGQPGRPVPSEQPRYAAPKKNEVTLLAGRTIVNSLESEHSLATGIEYRRRLGSFLEGTIGLLDEGETGTIDRAGIELQLWLVREFVNDRLSLGFGCGGYYAADHEHTLNHKGDDYFLSGVASLTAAFRFAEDWRIRATWSRVHSQYDRDTDVILLGLGYLF